MSIILLVSMRDISRKGFSRRNKNLDHWCTGSDLLFSEKFVSRQQNPFFRRHLPDLPSTSGLRLIVARECTQRKHRETHFSRHTHSSTFARATSLRAFASACLDAVMWCRQDYPMDRKILSSGLLDFGAVTWIGGARVISRTTKRPR